MKRSDLSIYIGAILIAVIAFAFLFWKSSGPQAGASYSSEEVSE